MTMFTYHIYMLMEFQCPVKGRIIKFEPSWSFCIYIWRLLSKRSDIAYQRLIVLWKPTEFELKYQFYEIKFFIFLLNLKKCECHENLLLFLSIIENFCRGTRQYEHAHATLQEIDLVMF